MIELSCFHPLKNLPAVLDSLLCYFFSNLTVPLFYLPLSCLRVCPVSLCYFFRRKNFFEEKISGSSFSLGILCAQAVLLPEDP